MFRAIVFTSLLAYASAKVCNICGDGKKVTAPDAIFSFPGQPEVSCGILEQLGEDGAIEIDQCAFLSPMIGACVCEEGVVQLIETSAQTAPPITPVAMTDAPVTPDADVPVTSAPVSAEPVTSAPTKTPKETDVPFAEAAVTSAPTKMPKETDAPIGEVPETSSAPVTEAAVTSAPTKMPKETDSPVADVPTTSAPVTDAAVTSAPVTDSPAAPVSIPVVTVTPVSAISEFPTASAMPSNEPSYMPSTVDPSDPDSGASRTGICVAALAGIVAAFV